MYERIFKNLTFLALVLNLTFFISCTKSGTTTPDLGKISNRNKGTAEGVEGRTGLLFENVKMNCTTIETASLAYQTKCFAGTIETINNTEIFVPATSINEDVNLVFTPPIPVEGTVGPSTTSCLTATDQLSQTCQLVFSGFALAGAKLQFDLQVTNTETHAVKIESEIESYPASIKKFDASVLNGTPNIGPINSYLNSTWKDIKDKGTAPAVDANLVNFTFNNTASGWQGSGTTQDPYRLTFNRDQYSSVKLGPTFAKSYSIWFKTNAFSDLGLMHVHGLFAAFVYNGQLFIGLDHYDRRFSTAIDDNWHHLVVNALPNGVISYFVDGIPQGEIPVGEPWYGSSGQTVIGANWHTNQYWGDYPNYYFTGSIATFHAFDFNLTQSQVSTFYQGLRPRFYVDTGAIQMTRLLPALVNSNSSILPSILLTGWHLDKGVTAVKVDGIAGSALSILSKSQLRFTPPQSNTSGFKKITLVTSQGEINYPNAIQYSPKNLTGMTAYLDPANVTASGKNGSSLLVKNWVSLISPMQAVSPTAPYPNPTPTPNPNGSFGRSGDNLVNPNGWQWNGSTFNFTDPFRLDFRHYSVFMLGNLNAESYTLWFKSPPLDFYKRFLFARYAGVKVGTRSIAENSVWVRKLEFYQWESLTHSFTISGEWNHLVITNYDSKRKFYLNGAFLGEQTVSSGEGTNSTILGASFYASTESPGWEPLTNSSIGIFQSYSRGLPPIEIESLFLEDAPRYLNLPPNN